MDPFERYEIRIKELELQLSQALELKAVHRQHITGLQNNAKGLRRTNKELLAALKQCRQALLHICHECPAFADDAPEFNEGGIGYEACGKAIEIINKAEGRTN